MTGVIAIIDLVFQIVQKANLTIPQALQLYHSIRGMSTLDFPELSDAQVIDLFQARAKAGSNWAQAELDKLAAAQAGGQPQG